MWPLVLIRRPLFVVHQTWIRNARGEVDWQQRLKRFVLRFAKSIAPGTYTLALAFHNAYNTRAISLYRVVTGGHA